MLKPYGATQSLLHREPPQINGGIIIRVRKPVCSFMLLGIMDADLGVMAGLPDDAFPAAIADFRGRIGIAKGIIASLEAR